MAQEVNVLSADFANSGFPPPPAEPMLRRFESLLNSEVDPPRTRVAFCVHVPKAAGNSMNVLLRQNRYFDIPIRGDDFFYYTPPDRWLELAKPGPATMFTGHFRLDHPLLARMWIPYVTLSVLRHPLDRMLSAYNFTLRREGTLWHSEVTAGAMSFVDYAAAFTAGVGTQYGYFDHTGTRSATSQDCLDNLLNKVTFYGLSDRFDEFAVVVGYLMGLRNVIPVPEENVTAEIPNPNGRRAKTSLTEEERAALDATLRDDLWFYDQALKAYEHRIAGPRLAEVVARSAPLIARCRDVRNEFSKIKGDVRAGQSRASHEVKSAARE
jgi:sulfotransferase famil protein